MFALTQTLTAPSPFVALVGYFFLRLGAETPHLRYPMCVLVMLTPVAGQCFHGSGANASYLEVGGKDTAVLMAVGNTLATIPGMIAPPLKLWLMRLTGSWMPLFSLAAAWQVAAAIFYAHCISLRPARDQCKAKTRTKIDCINDDTLQK